MNDSFVSARKVIDVYCRMPCGCSERQIFTVKGGHIRDDSRYKCSAHLAPDDPIHMEIAVLMARELVRLIEVDGASGSVNV